LAPDSVGPAAEAVVEGLANGAVALLENTRFYPQEEQNDPAHAARLAKLADLYVNDAFGAAHRAHASTEGIARLLPSAAGLHMAAELSALERALADPVRPFAAIIGGAKASDKIEVLKRLASLADVLLIGGGMGNTFLHARGVNLQASLLEPDLVETARDVDEIAARAHCRVVLPVDGVVAAEASAGAERRTVPVSEIPPGWRILDVGPRTTAAYGEALQGVKTVLWNGPMGVYELAPFAEGTNRLARLLAESGAFVVVGGGDAVAAVQAAGVADKMGHLSTGGGATLEFVEGKILPGVAVLPDA
ncbi:MAG: phosphoglycerate kinase, partial [Actinobacteria bacterium]|nr:phosphoglycerate kinase [Actinomycetota bacterium]